MRPDFDAWILLLARDVAIRGTCSLRQVGAIAVDGRHPIEVGYNGAPSGERHCAHERYARPEDDPDVAWVRGSWRCARALHAEANVVDFAKARGRSLAGLAVYVTCRPCCACTVRLLEARVGSIVTPRGQDVRALVEALRGTSTVLREV